ncbi:cob(I)yrinic acid a,c-diamide adenosyltransferase [Heliophilum fasciatum]|uniref:Cob(I)yrinic acid a,c-diamide adenosyltransferase n=1 Tax=Heliophilum fasciatum TaxID=35700 RepID=A0A4R2RMJ1_9FIRM|nr:cob(I)yrinic acid a,c-diamide adenosyltransferase [Heliophilum fasciatum]MCW2278542.1 cob(I)alamin adenosyltransferase [Heliophilum fasciatum]TCP63497.1 cob(I)yrinic acid a,c-diamide adenosyltransferase [Heliophilum fasciatum]
MSGYIQVITGNGKGKTTMALGECLQVAAQGLKVHIVQFQKGSSYMGELFSLQRIPTLTITQFGFGCPQSAMIRSGLAHCVSCGDCFRRNRDRQNPWPGQGFAFACTLLQDEQANLVVLDEISHIINAGFISVEQVLTALAKRRPSLSVILTGRRMPEQLIAISDRAVECCAVKHPLADGIAPSRRGIEY